MPLYSYRALAEDGDQVRGHAVASSSAALRRELAQQGLLLQGAWRKHGFFGARRRVALDALYQLARDLGLLLRAGMALPEALQLLTDQTRDRLLASALTDVAQAIQDGSALGAAFARHSEVFDPLFLAALRTGEQSGNLEQALDEFNEDLRQRIELQKLLSRALTYPLFLLATLGAILAFLLVFVMPRFAAMYADFDAQLPVVTLLVIGVMENLHFVLAGLVGAFVIGWMLLRVLAGSEAGRQGLDRAKRALPLIGSLLESRAVAQYLRSLAMLLKAGTPLVEAMGAVQSAIANGGFRERSAVARRLVTDGAGLSAAARDTGLLPEVAVRIVEVGEASGRLDAVLKEAAAYYEEQVRQRTSILMTLAEPALVLVAGLLIGAVIVAMYLPVFHIADVLQ